MAYIKRESGLVVPSPPPEPKKPLEVFVKSFDGRYQFADMMDALKAIHERPNTNIVSIVSHNSAFIVTYLATEQLHFSERY